MPNEPRTNGLFLMLRPLGLVIQTKVDDPEGLLEEAIFGSLKGNAADIARGLGPETTVYKVLELLDGVFGRKTSPDVLIQDLYKINQDPKEKVSNFGIRLKVAVDRIIVFHPEPLTQLEAAKQNVREGLRYYYEVLQADYTTLLTKARSIEAEKSTSTPTTTVTTNAAVPVETAVDTQVDNLNKKMSELITIVKNNRFRFQKIKRRVVVTTTMDKIKSLKVMGMVERT